jgi:hypothetical protein
MNTMRKGSKRPPRPPTSGPLHCTFVRLRLDNVEWARRKAAECGKSLARFIDSLLTATRIVDRS